MALVKFYDGKKLLRGIRSVNQKVSERNKHKTK